MNFDCWATGAWAAGSWVDGSWCPGAVPAPVGGMAAIWQMQRRRDEEEEALVLALMETLLEE